MKLMQVVRTAAIAVLLLPAVARASEDPETVYAKLHQAALANRADQVLDFASAKQKAILASTSKAQQAGVIAFMSKLMPQAYKVTGKSVAPDGASAQLQAEGRGGLGGSGAMYLDAMFVLEAGMWKVDRWTWTSDKPPAIAMTAQPKPAAMPAESKARATAPPPAPAPRKTASAVPPAKTAPTLGVAKPPCVYKAVMTEEDLRACGVGTR